jgi:hypothetical protein
LILGIEPLALHQAFAQAKRHAGVVGPLAGLQVKRAAPNHVRKRFERAGRLEFQCAAEREPEQRAVVAVPQSPAALPVLVVEPTIRFNIEAVHGRRLLFQLTWRRGESNLLLPAYVRQCPGRSLSEVRQVFPGYKQKCLDIGGFLLLGQPGRIA